MQLLYGLLIGAGFCFALFLAYSHGRKQPDRYEVPKVDDHEKEEERERAKRMRKGFEQLMGYNEKIARSGKG
ncbi:hypothetical protein [Paenibacillus silvisoli]|uniref:hypothetical protein n=1 Tax=Paenibacillus silvisoli TaxID=3110539 RepID=UPI0028055E55|nr:hypothetical protein [Paenibacillus silvisoli]